MFNLIKKIVNIKIINRFILDIFEIYGQENSVLVSTP